MSSAAHFHSDGRQRRVSIRHSRATTSTETSSAAEVALQQILDRRLRRREGRPPSAVTRTFGSAQSGVVRSIDRFGLPQWLFRVGVLGFVTVVLGAAVVTAIPRGGPRRFPVAGTVVLKGRPLAQAALEFHGAGADGPFTVALGTNETGAFRRPASAGLPSGKYAVVVKSGCLMPHPQAERGTPVRIPAPYTSVEATPLKITVNEEQSTFEFVLR